ncbi:hypothetical protein BWQ96_06183 [Gracilariopsis chorda]|uniref:Uncharacterized protein n=1 Tax=Gracilariopsis chorda TaxID=448386 RepID=A0A2V3IPV1_9FLOR|nr:hypothetical protein BWQ96_06183 [Gracilariopsis chorda]|eukprot:PXF44102.1 hypothetical protein BWQ96_06183 [Gracilariopsis chorda]
MAEATALKTLSKNLRGRHLYPFAIGFTSVLLASAYLFRLEDEDYLNTVNKRFAKPFVKKAPGDDSHGH